MRLWWFAVCLVPRNVVSILPTGSQDMECIDALARAINRLTICMYVYLSLSLSISLYISLSLYIYIYIHIYRDIRMLTGVGYLS